MLFDGKRFAIHYISEDLTALLCLLSVHTYLFFLQAALCVCDEFDVLTGESQQLTVACSQRNILKKNKVKFTSLNRMNDYSFFSHISSYAMLSS